MIASFKLKFVERFFIVMKNLLTSNASATFTG